LFADDPKARVCGSCGEKTTLQLKFAFGLDATDAEAEVRAVFRPRRLESWRNKKREKVTFVPFLVILRRGNRKDAAWLPYWHLVEKGKRRATKYGQWAPFMDAHLFEDLLSQARKAGYLRKF
jgi:hypothetical protein